MNDELELLATLRELKQLYTEGELREYDFDTRISDVKRVIELGEAQHSEQ